MLRGRLNRILLEAWFAARRGEIMPRRDDLGPAALKLTMPLLLIFDYIGPDEVVCRMMGTRLRQFLGFEMTGLNILAVGQADLRERRRAR